VVLTSNSRSRVLLTIIVWVATLAFLFPVIWFLLLSLKSPDLIFATPPVFWFKPTLGAYRETILSGYSNQLWNSLLVASGSTAVCLILGVPAAYAFDRFTFFGRKDLLFWMLSVRMAPPIAVVLPFYLVMRRLELVGTLTALILVNLTVNLPLVVWLMKDFFAEVPRSLDESALVDGATRLRAFVNIIFPLAAPGIVVSTVFAFIFSWNEFFFALILSSINSQTLTVAAASFWTNVQLEWHKLAAVSMVTILPPFLLAFLLGRYLVRGLTFGAVKE